MEFSCCPLCVNCQTGSDTVSETHVGVNCCCCYVQMYSWGLAWPRNSSDSGELGAAWLATMPPMCHSSVPLLISPTSTVALKFARRGSPIEGLCGGMRDCDEQQFKFKPSRSPFVPPARVPRVGLWKKRGLSVESHRGPVGWLLGFQAEGHSSRGEGADVPHCWPCTSFQ